MLYVQLNKDKTDWISITNTNDINTNINENEVFFIEGLPKKENIKNKIALLKYDKIKGLYYVYEDIPKTKEELQAEEIEKLKRQLATCQQSITELTALASTMLAPK